MREILQTNQKALRINLNPHIYGSFAEIGAGQEVARHFFQAGGASGTVAKTISAYDMIFSDSIYGKEQTGRYVCESRLNKMLDKEYDLLIKRLVNQRDPKTTYFAFANTISAINFHKTNKAHGWVGIRFQHNPGSTSNTITLHIKLHDQQNVLQQEAIGKLGANLVYASFYLLDDPIVFLESIMDGLDKERIEIDFIKTEGVGLERFSNQELNIHLVKAGYTSAIMFDKNGNPVLPQDKIYKKTVLLARGSYRPPTLINFDMIEKSLGRMATDFNESSKDVQILAEISTSTFNEEKYETDDYLARISLLNKLNYNVLITNYTHFSKLNIYLKSIGVKNIGIVLGIFNFVQMFNDAYKEVEGGVLVSLGEMLEGSVKIYVYPSLEDEQLVTLKDIQLTGNSRHLLNYILDSNKVEALADYDPNLIHIYSKAVANLISSGNKEWKVMVPKILVHEIENLRIFHE